MSMHNPAHSGEILKELVIEPMELTITDASEHFNVSPKGLSKVLNGRGSITLEMAMGLELALKKQHVIIGGSRATIRVACSVISTQICTEGLTKCCNR